MFWRQCCFVRNFTYNTLETYLFDTSCYFASLRKQPTFGDATTGFPTKWRLRNERRSSILMTRHNPDLGSAPDWLNQISHADDQSPRSTILDRSPWDSTAILYFSVISRFPLKTVLFEIFLQFSLPQPYTKLKLEKNSGYTRPTLFVGWGEGLDLCELENAQKRKSVLRLVHDCR